MKDKILTIDDIRNFCNELGLDHIGFMKCRILSELQPYFEYRKAHSLENEFEESSIEKRINPAHYMNDAKTIISIAFPYSFSEPNKNSSIVNNGFSLYTRGKDYHVVVKQYLEKIKEFLIESGYKAMTFVDSNTLPERYIAHVCGIGFIGKNGLLITKKYGSYVFLGEILTDLELESSRDVNPENMLANIAQYVHCGTCEICYNNCKTKAIRKSTSSTCSLTHSNPNICTSYITQKKDLTDSEITLLHGKVFGCDDCQLQCPYNRTAKCKGLQAFSPLPEMNKTVNKYATMNNSFFKTNVKISSAGWRGKNVIKRNALLKLVAEGTNFTQLKTDSPYLQSYIDRILTTLPNTQ